MRHRLTAIIAVCITSLAFAGVALPTTASAFPRR